MKSEPQAEQQKENLKKPVEPSPESPFQESAEAMWGEQAGLPRYLNNQAAGSTGGDDGPQKQPSFFVQTKLEIGATDDEFEREADRMADRMIEADSSRRNDEPSPPLTGPRPSISSVQSKSDALHNGASSNLHGTINRTQGKGQPLTEKDKNFFETQLGKDLSQVRLHNSPQAHQAAAEIKAKAFTVGEDIYFAQGRYRPGTHQGQWLMGHELTHVVQQSKPAARRIQRNGNGDDSGGQNSASTSSLAADLRELLQRNGAELSTEDENRLADDFPNGFDIEDQEVLFLSQSSNRIDGFRLRGLRVFEVGPLQPGFVAFIFKVDKGRSILLATQGGGSVLQDAGAVNQADAEQLVTAINRIVGSGTAAPPSLAILSHTDADHINAVRRAMETAGFANTSIQIAMEQLRSTTGQRDWQRMNINLNPTQQIIEIQVTGAGGAAGRTGPAGGQVHVHRVIVGNMELTEFRSVTAHEQMMSGSRRSFNKNRTSPVTVVTDMVTGERMVFTADAEGRQFNEIVTAVGEQAFRRIIGAEGRNLRLMEVPHHGGRVSGGPNVSGMIRMLQLAFEASDGSINFITQTSQSFAQGRSAVIQFLEASSINVEQVLNEPAQAGAAQSEVVRARGGTLETITVDTERVRSVLEIAGAQEGQIQRAYQRLHEIRTLQERAGPMHEGLTRANGPNELIRSLRQIQTGLTETETGIRQAVGRVWQAMETAGGGSEGMRGGRNMSQVTAELTSLTRHLETVNLNTFSNSMDVHEAGLSAHARIFKTMLEMFNALRSERYSDLHNLKGTFRAQLQQARAILGHAEVFEHVRSAWQVTRGHWTGEQIQRVARNLGAYAHAHRIMMTEFKIELSESLGRQIQLNEMMELASHGRLGGGRSSIPMRSRVGAGIMAAIELIRIGLEAAVTINEAIEASEARAQRNKVQGVRTVYWWVMQGVNPKLALVSKNWWAGYDVVSDNLSQNKIQTIITKEEKEEGTPDYEMVVVEDIPSKDLIFYINSIFAEANTLEDWHRINDGNPIGPTFQNFNGKWGVNLWHRKESHYLYIIRPDIQKPLNRLLQNLEAGQEKLLQSDILGSEESSVKTVGNTATIGTDRYAYVFKYRGGLTQLDFEDWQPRFIRIGTQYEGRNTFALVRAADLRTYKQVSQYYWRHQTGTYIDRYGMGQTYAYYRNNEGLALVDPDDLINTVGTAVYEASVRVSQEADQAIQQKPEKGNGRVTLPVSHPPHAAKGTPPPAVQSDIKNRQGQGSPLPESARNEFESRAQADFSGVSIHTDARAEQLNQALGSQAFTSGNDIFFNKGQYNPQSQSGKALLEHELIHVVQQRSGEAEAAQQSDQAYQQLEEEADRPLESAAEDKAATKDTGSSNTGATLQRWESDENVYISTITEAYARTMDTAVLLTTMETVANELSSPNSSIDNEEALTENLLVMAREARVRRVPIPQIVGNIITANNETQLAAPDEVATLQAQVDAIITVIESKFEEIAPATAAYMDSYRNGLAFLFADELSAEQERLKQSLKNLEILTKLQDFVPQDDSVEGDLQAPVAGFKTQIKNGIHSLLTEDEQTAMEDVEAAKLAYLDAFTRLFMEAFEEARQQVETMNNQLSQSGHLDWAKSGLSQNNQFVFPWVRTEIDIVGSEGESLLDSMNAIGATSEIASAEPLERLAFLLKSGDQMSILMQRARAINAAYIGLLLYDALIEETWSNDAIRAGDHFIGNTLRKSVIQASLEQLQSSQIDDEQLKRIEGILTDSQGDVQRRLQEIEEFKRKMDWFVTIASTLVGMRAFTAVSGVVAKGLQGAGALTRGTVSFVAGSLAFTGASATTRAALTASFDPLKPGQLGKQALMDMATLGILKGAGILVGLKYGGAAGFQAGLRTGARQGARQGLNRIAQGLQRGARQMPPSVAHATTFGALWAWSTTLAITQQEGDLTLAGVGEAIVQNGIRTGLDLMVLTFLNRAMMAPRVSASGGNELARPLESEWNGRVAEYKGIGEQLKRWLETSERSVSEAERLLEQGRGVLTQMRLMMPRFVKAEMLTIEQAETIAAELTREARAAVNTRDAMRLGIEQSGEIGFSYRGSAENVMQYLTRLKTEGILTSVRAGRRAGVIEVTTAEGQLRVFYPRGGVSPEGTDIIDVMAEGVQRAAPGLPANETSTAVSALRLLPPGRSRQLVAEFEKGSAEPIIRWLSRTDAQTAFQGENNGYWVDMLRSMLQNAEQGETLLGQRATTLRAWYESGFERAIGDNKKTVENFKSFLSQIENYNGTLDVVDAAQARAIVDNYLRTNEAHGFDPVQANQLRGRAFQDPTAEHGPYLNVYDYLVRNHITEGKFIDVLLDRNTWVIRVTESGPAQAFRFRDTEYPPIDTIDLAQDLNALTNLVQTAEATSDTAVRQATMRQAQPLLDKLSFLSRIRGSDSLNDARALLGRAAALGGRGPMPLPPGRQTLQLPPGAPPSPLQQRGRSLYDRQQEVLRRAKNLNLTENPAVSLARARRPTRTTREETMNETERIIQEAEEVLNELGRRAIQNRFGGSSGRALKARVLRGHGLSALTEADIGDALHLVRGRQGIGEAELRGLLQAQRVGANIQGILDAAPSAAERNTGLRLVAELMQVEIPGADHLVRDLGTSKNAFRGSMWQLRFIDEQIGMDNLNQIQRIEHPETGEMTDPKTGDPRPIARRTDIVMKDGRHIELKSWSHWFGDSLTKQFSKDLSLRTDNFSYPTGIFQLHYAFDGTPYIPELGPIIDPFLAQEFIRNELKNTLIERMNAEGVDQLTRKFMLEAFEHHQHLVTIY